MALGAHEWIPAIGHREPFQRVAWHLERDRTLHADEYTAHRRALDSRLSRTPIQRIGEP